MDPKEKLQSELKGNADEILNDPERMKEIIKTPELVVELLKEKDELEIVIEIEGEPMYLVRPPKLPDKFKRMIIRKH